jgi:hypothetical protein
MLTTVFFQTQLVTREYYTANERRAGENPIYVFQKGNCAASLFPRQNYKVLSPNSFSHIFVRNLYISRIGLPFLLQGNMWTDPGNI